MTDEVEHVVYEALTEGHAEGLPCRFCEHDARVVVAALPAAGRLREGKVLASGIVVVAQLAPIHGIMWHEHPEYKEDVHVVVEAIEVEK